MSELVNLRNEVSGVSMSVTAKEAQRILSHPVFGKVNKVVRTPKPEVLAHSGGRDFHPDEPRSEGAVRMVAPEPESGPRRRYTKKESE